MSHTTGLETIASLLRGPGGKIFTGYVEVLIPADKILYRCTVRFTDGFAIAIGEIDVFAAIIKAVYLASIMFEEIIYRIGSIVLWFFPHDRLAVKQEQEKMARKGSKYLFIKKV